MAPGRTCGDAPGECPPAWRLPPPPPPVGIMSSPIRWGFLPFAGSGSTGLKGYRCTPSYNSVLVGNRTKSLRTVFVAPSIWTRRSGRASTSSLPLARTPKPRQGSAKRRVPTLMPLSTVPSRPQGQSRGSAGRFDAMIPTPCGRSGPGLFKTPLLSGLGLIGRRRGFAAGP